MILSLFRRHARPEIISTLYGTIVAQARLPCFYREFAIADTVNGRFELLVLHLSAVLKRLADDPTLRELGQGLFDLFCQDMDNNLREMGVGDLSVPKEMRRMGEAFYGRAQAYEAALSAEGEEVLTEAIARNVYGGSAPVRAAPAWLAAYMRETVLDLARQAPDRILAGEIRLPDPTATLLVEGKGRFAED